MKKMLFGMFIVLALAMSANAAIDMTIDSDIYDIGDTVTVTWTGSQGSGNDWIGIYKPEHVPGSDNSTWWYYCTAATEGTMLFEDVQLDEGDWNIYFFDIGDDVANGWYEIADTETFTVVPEPMTMTLLGLGGLALIRRKRS